MWNPLTLRVPPDETPSVSRMREICTSGLTRGEGRISGPPLLDREPFLQYDARIMPRCPSVPIVGSVKPSQRRTDRYLVRHDSTCICQNLNSLD